MTLANVRNALKARRKSLSPGPRTLTDVATALNVDLGNLRAGLAGDRALPAATRAALLLLLPELQTPEVNL